MSTQNIVIASSNHGKIREIKDLCASWPTNMVASQHPIDVVESGHTFVENACLKAQAYAKANNMSALADDSGLLVHALNDEPGLYSARYAGPTASNIDNINKLLAELKEIPRPWLARFVCVLVLLRHPEDPDPIVTHGSWNGEIVPKPQGNMNFGFDPIFKPNHHDCTAAELMLEIKNRYSHRAKAMHKMYQHIARMSYI